jgi:hypothetical protein
MKILINSEIANWEAMSRPHSRSNSKYQYRAAHPEQQAGCSIRTSPDERLIPVVTTDRGPMLVF